MKTIFWLSACSVRFTDFGNSCYTYDVSLYSTTGDVHFVRLLQPRRQRGLSGLPHHRQHIRRTALSSSENNHRNSHRLPGARHGNADESSSKPSHCAKPASHLPGSVCSESRSQTARCAGQLSARSSHCCTDPQRLSQPDQRNFYQERVPGVRCAAASGCEDD